MCATVITSPISTHIKYYLDGANNHCFRGEKRVRGISLILHLPQKFMTCMMQMNLTKYCTYALVCTGAGFSTLKAKLPWSHGQSLLLKSKV